MPDVLGLTTAKALARMKHAGFKITIHREYSSKPSGTVITTSAHAGRNVVVGSSITVTVAREIPKVPNVLGFTSTAAISKLKKAGYSVTVRKVETSAVSAGHVISTNPGPGSERLPGRTVLVAVAKAPPPSPTPTTSCTSGYSPCLPAGPSDYDCYGGSGDGPAYTKPGVTYRVTGSDPYGLDADNDGYGCE